MGDKMVKMNEQRLTYARRLRRLTAVFGLGFAAVAAVLIFWSVIQQPTLTARADNPRRVEAELRVQRGRIVDAQDRVLVESVPVNAGGLQERVYPYPAAEPAVGYYSLRYGTAGIEEGAADLLRGETDEVEVLLRRLYLHEPQVGQDVRLTLNMALQERAVALMAQHAPDTAGAAVLLSLSADGAIRAMVSLPSYDPNLLDEQFDALAADDAAPLLNRATQGVYQPGLILQPFLLASAVDEGTVAAVDDISGQVYLLNELAAQWTADDVRAAWAAWGLLQGPDLPLAVAAPETPPIEDLRVALRGEESLTVTPLQVALAMAALGNNGRPISPRLLSAVRIDDRWQSLDTEGRIGEAAVSERAAQAILAALPQDGRVAEYAVTVRTGPQRRSSWYVGLAPAGEPRYALAVVLEDEADLSAVQTIGRELLLAALN